MSQILFIAVVAFIVLSKNPQARKFLLDILTKLLAHLKTSAAKLPDTKQFETVRRWLDEPVVTKDHSDHKVRHQTSRATRKVPKRTVIQSRSGNSVKVAHSLPRQGRSTWLDGLLRGPWG